MDREKAGLHITVCVGPLVATLVEEKLGRFSRWIFRLFPLL